MAMTTVYTLVSHLPKSNCHRSSKYLLLLSRTAPVRCRVHPMTSGTRTLSGHLHCSSRTSNRRLPCLHSCQVTRTAILQQTPRAVIFGPEHIRALCSWSGPTCSHYHHTGHPAWRPSGPGHQQCSAAYIPHFTQLRQFHKSRKLFTVPPITTFFIVLQASTLVISRLVSTQQF